MISQAGTTGPTQTCAVPGPSAQLPTDDMPAADTDDMPVVAAHICASAVYHQSRPDPGPHAAKKSQLASPPQGPGSAHAFRRAAVALTHPSSLSRPPTEGAIVGGESNAGGESNTGNQSESNASGQKSACSRDTPERRRWNAHVPSRLRLLSPASAAAAAAAAAAARTDAVSPGGRRSLSSAKNFLTAE